MYEQYQEREYRSYLFIEDETQDAVDEEMEVKLFQSLGLSEGTENTEPDPGFWRRQFQDRVTKRQRKFDWIFGVILPLICFFFDPIVFGDGTRGSGLLSGIRPFAYILSFTAIMATMAWLLWGPKLKWLNIFLSGLFAVSFVTAFSIGIYLSPYSLFGLIILIGALGFTPFFTSFVFLRNSIRAFRSAKMSLDMDVIVPSFALAALASFVIPYLFNLR